MHPKRVDVKALFLLIVILAASGCESVFHGSKIHAAASKGKTDSVAKELATENSDVNEKSDRGQSPLHLAVSNGHYETVKFLVENGADVNLPDKRVIRNELTVAAKKLKEEVDGATPLHYAARLKYLGIAKYLLSQGADVNARSSRGNSVLHFAYFAENNEPMIDFLITSGADGKARNVVNESPAEAGMRYLGLERLYAEQQREFDEEQRRQREMEEDERRQQEMEDEELMQEE